MESKKHMDAFRGHYDDLNAEDKVMDKAFKREFNDVTAVQQDQLYRLFRKRPRSVAFCTPTYKSKCVPLSLLSPYYVAQQNCDYFGNGIKDSHFLSNFIVRQYN